MAFLDLGFSGLLAEGPFLGEGRGIRTGGVGVFLRATAFLLRLAFVVEIMGVSCSGAGVCASEAGVLSAEESRSLITIGLCLEEVVFVVLWEAIGKDFLVGGEEGFG